MSARATDSNDSAAAPTVKMTSLAATLRAPIRGQAPSTGEWRDAGHPLRHWRLRSGAPPVAPVAHRHRSRAPSTTFPHEIASDAGLFVVGVIAAPGCKATPPSANTHPSRNIGPFTLAQREKSMRITAMTGNWTDRHAYREVGTELMSANGVLLSVQGRQACSHRPRRILTRRLRALRRGCSRVRAAPFRAHGLWPA
jgi:hypothetical protein